MNRYPLWKYIVIVVALVIGIVYTLPNFYGESPAVQVSSGKATVKVTEQTLQKVEDLLKGANLHPNGVFYEQGAQQNTIRVRFDPTEAEKQLQAREVLEKALNPNRDDPQYIVALNLVPNTPQWLLSINALPMYLGLDLRGGVHFLMEVDMDAAMKKMTDQLVNDFRTERSHALDMEIHRALTYRAASRLVDFRSAVAAEERAEHIIGCSEPACHLGCHDIPVNRGRIYLNRTAAEICYPCAELR